MKNIVIVNAHINALISLNVVAGGEMKSNICAKCTPDRRKRINYLCDQFASPDGMPFRCIHKQSSFKLRALRYYLDIVSMAMKNRNGKRYYLDLFSGPGLCFDRDSGRFLDGSSMLALRLEFPFTNYIFNDDNITTSKTLSSRAKSFFPGLSERVVCTNYDINSEIDRIIGMIDPRSSIVVAFIDPNGLDVHFATLKALSSIGHLDLIINYSISDLKRNYEIYRQNNDKARLFFGRDVLPSAPEDCYENYKNDIKKLGFIAVEDDIDKKIKVTTRSGADIYYLLYASKHPKGLQFWREVKKYIGDPDIFD